MSLTAKQQRFVAEYLIDLNATAAYKRAGYTATGNAAEFYAYFLIDPRDGQIFYVGKGKGARVQQHAKHAANGKADNIEKYKRIRAIQATGARVVESIFDYCASESEAFAVEKALITALRAHGLTNIVNGTVTNADMVREKAKEMLAALKPFSEWLAGAGAEVREQARALSGDEQSCYEFIRQSLLVASR